MQVLVICVRMMTSGTQKLDLSFVSLCSTCGHFGLSNPAQPCCSAAAIEVLDAAVAALELLEWNSVSDDRGGLVATLCECLRALAAAISAASVAAAAADAAATAASSDSENAKSPDSDVEAAEVVEQQPPTSVRYCCSSAHSSLVIAGSSLLSLRLLDAPRITCR